MSLNPDPDLCTLLYSLKMGVHSFIIYTSFHRGCKEAGANPSWLCVRDGVHPGKVTNPLQGLCWDEQPVISRGNFRVVSWPNLHAIEGRNQNTGGKPPQEWEELANSTHKRPGWQIQTQNLLALRHRCTTVPPLIWSCLCKNAPTHQAVNLVRSESFKAHNSLFVCLCVVLKIYFFSFWFYFNCRFWFIAPVVR